MSSFPEPTGVLPHLTSEELFTYLPNFVAECDPQVGEWVLVTPIRREALLDPLIRLWEGKKPGEETLGRFTSAKANPRRYSLSTFVSDVGGAQLAPLSVAMPLLCNRECACSGGGSVSGQIPLYLHVRLGLLTDSAPSVFGGEDNIEAIITQQGFEKPQRITLYVPAVRTFTRGELSFAGGNAPKRAKKAVMAPISSSSASWRESVEASAHQEWIEWQRHHWGR